MNDCRSMGSPPYSKLSSLLDNLEVMHSPWRNLLATQDTERSPANAKRWVEWDGSGIELMTMSSSRGSTVEPPL